LLVTVFAFNPASKRDYRGLKPGYAHLPLPTLCTMTNKWLWDNLYRDAAPSASNQFLHRDSFLVAIEFVPRSRLPAPICTLMAKTRAMLRSHPALEKS
jgi:hypothetical protein